MGYEPRDAEELLRLGVTSPEVAQRAWGTRWDAVADPAGLCARLLPPTLDFSTSGTTGPSRTWRRHSGALWHEAGMLAALLAPARPDAVVSFVPPVHLFGALTSVLVPAHLRLPAWYRPGFLGRLPDTGTGRVAVMATPWIFRLLLENPGWVDAHDRLVVLYGGAPLPATATALLERTGPDRAEVVELLGSTEAGGIASRTWRAGRPPAWTLLPDVRFAGPPGPGPEPLSITSPRLAFRPGGAPPATSTTDDVVRRLDDRRFALVGRDGRLVKVNGRRIDLDVAERAVGEVLDCADLALVPVGDDTIGEHVDLVVVLHPGGALRDLDLRAAITRLGVRPRRVRAAPRIERSALGKTRREPPVPTGAAGTTRTTRTTRTAGT